MSVIVNEIKREVQKVSIETKVVGRSFTVTVSEHDAALIYYLAGRSAGMTATTLYKMFAGIFRDTPIQDAALKDSERPIHISALALSALASLSREVK